MGCVLLRTVTRQLLIYICHLPIPTTVFIRHGCLGSSTLVFLVRQSCTHPAASLAASLVVVMVDLSDFSFLQRVGLNVELGSPILNSRDRYHRDSIANPGKGGINWKASIKKTLMKLLDRGALRTEDSERLGKFLQAYVSVHCVDEHVPQHCPKKVACEAVEEYRELLKEKKQAKKEKKARERSRSRAKRSRSKSPMTPLGHLEADSTPAGSSHRGRSRSRRAGTVHAVPAQSPQLLQRLNLPRQPSTNGVRHSRPAYVRLSRRLHGQQRTYRRRKTSRSSSAKRCSGNNIRQSSVLQRSRRYNVNYQLCYNH